jgi:glycine oxidase
VPTADAVVVGGGVVGCAAAWALARAGLAPLLLERDTVGAHASRVAAGMLAPLAEAHGEAAALPLGLESLDRFPAVVAELREQSGIDARLARSGILRVACDDATAARLRARAERLAAQGVEWLDAAAARARAPGLGPALRGALWSPREGHVDAELLTTAYARAAQALGARVACGTPAVSLVREGPRVRGVRTPAGEWSAPWVVLATGPWAAETAAAFGLRAPLPVRPVRGQLAVLRPAGAPLGTIAWGDAAYLVPQGDGRVRVGATEEEAGFECRTTAAGVRGLLDAATALVPALGDAAFEGAEAGLRPGTPDGLPLLGPAPELDGLVLAVGHFRNGILLSPTTGILIADLVAGKPWPEGARAFRPDRFGAS